ncbi:MAG: nucleotidyltransferase, partial [Candidatus Aenigmatarchaeota archaeon]
MIGLEEQLSLFKLIGTELKKRTETIVIGGSAMLFYGAKTATKDVDIVLSEEDRKKIVKILEKIGFEKRKIMLDEKQITKNKPVLMTRNEMRLDLFSEEIFSFKISENILARVKEMHEFGKFVIKIISPEDIILLKCATDRTGDRIDALSIIKRFDINWDIIIQECLWQTEHGKKMFVVFLLDFIEEINDIENIIPKEIIKKIR